MIPPEHVELVTEGHKVLYRAIAVDEVPVSASDAVRVVPAEREEAMQGAIDAALSAMHSSAYVGGPSERDAWRAALTALGPFETQHTGQDAALSGAGFSPADTTEEA